MKKRGAWKYHIIISLILGLIVLGLVIGLIFPELLEAGIDWEVCRQSIYLRNTAKIQSDRPATTFLEKSADLVPLKCKTEVIEIDTDNGEEVMKEISDKLVQCLVLFKKGDGEEVFDIFPINFVEQRKDCPVCFRMTFSEKTRKEIQTPLTLAHYLFTHDLEGNWLPPEEFMTDDGRFKYSKKSYAGYLDIPIYNSFRLLTSDNWKEKDDWEGNDYGSRGTIDVSEGVLLIGMYYYSNQQYITPEILKLRSTKYSVHYPFYAQIDIDEELRDCKMHFIPA